jgi:serine phosphatase RsbU (regulator of sigma subunit)
MKVNENVMALVFFLICAVIIPIPIFSNEVITIDDTFKSMSIVNQVSYLEDKGKNLTIDDVSQKIYDWKKSTNKSINFGFTTSAYWFRFTIDCKQNKRKDCYFEIDYPRIDEVEFYIPKNGGYELKKTGDHFPFYNREMIYKNYVFPLSTDRGKQTYYLRIFSTKQFNYNFTLWSQRSYMKMINTELPLYWIYYGILIIMVLYNIFIFFSVRKISYIYYSIFITSWIFFQLSIQGFAFQYLWPDSVWWAERANPFFINLSLVSLSLFVASYINFKKYFRVMDKINMFFILVPNAILCILTFIWSFQISIRVSTGMAFYSCAFELIIVLIAMFRGSRAARFAIIGFAVCAVAVFIYVFATFGILPAKPFIKWLPQIGGVSMVVFFSLGLADEINVLKNELLDLNLHLEQKVVDRTNELRRARDELWGEMELAKKIQTVLLPRDPRIQGYDIAVYMEPAADVGGDYYDVINAAGRDWVVIGDVSGHGIQAGLIMMMVQTSINTVINSNSDLPPSKMLHIINKTIINNIRLLNSDKYITIMILAVHENGKFNFSGLHQDIIIYRTETGKVEIIETTGMWIGIMDNLDHLLNDRNVSLQPGDTMLLYTDGITEAWEKGTVENFRDPAMKMFGVDRLNHIFKETAVRPLDEIKKSIIKALDNYDCNDDVTMVIIRRL